MPVSEDDPVKAQTRPDLRESLPRPQEGQGRSPCSPGEGRAMVLRHLMLAVGGARREVSRVK